MPNISELLVLGENTIIFLFNTLLYIRNVVFSASFLLTVKIVSSIISLVLAFGIVWLVMKMRLVSVRVENLEDMMSMAQVDRKRVLRGWLQVQERLQKGDEANIRLAIIEADKLLDTVLKRMGYAGETMADRLKSITPAQLRTINELWTAHKVRNNIVHDPDFVLTSRDALEMMGIYERVFREMNLID